MKNKQNINIQFQKFHITLNDDLFFCFRMDYHISSPWDVGNLEEFLYFCCPECDERSQSKELFLQHAIHLHPTSTEFLNRFDTKEEDVFDLKKEEGPDENDFIKDSDIKVEMIKSEENSEESWNVDQNTIMDSACEKEDKYNSTFILYGRK